MEIPFYLAMTPDEIGNGAAFPDHLAWMSAHFSPKSELLCGLPKILPAKSILIIDDSFPMGNHDTDSIIIQLNKAMEGLDLSGILLDFQKKYTPELQKFADELGSHFPNFVAVSPEYDSGNAIVFLPPVPPYISVHEYLSPWSGRVLWLDTSMTSLEMHIKKESINTQTAKEYGNMPFESTEFCAHYNINSSDDRIEIQFQRTENDCKLLLQKAAELGVTKGIGLYQEFKK